MYSHVSRHALKIDQPNIEAAILTTGNEAVGYAIQILGEDYRVTYQKSYDRGQPCHEWEVWHKEHQQRVGGLAFFQGDWFRLETPMGIGQTRILVPFQTRSSVNQLMTKAIDSILQS